ncbi:DNA-binding transcriptional LysR family regulator [Pseudomonas lini]|nr:DNA-binding transcriptional LysR family regulator [Pseudomonas lini]
MAKSPQPDQALLSMPSFKAMRSFVAAAKYRNFTRAAEALCVTQAAISRRRQRIRRVGV